MPSILLNKFGGEIPRITNPRKLPKSSAKYARDVDLTSGDLVPIKVNAPFQCLHEADGTVKPELTRERVTYIPKPPVVLENSNHYYLTRQNDFTDGVPWFGLRMYAWVTYVDPDTGEFTVDPIFTGSSPAYPTIDYTKDGIVARSYLNRTISFDTVAGVGYTIWGPIFEFIFSADEDYRGGPDTAYNFPATANWNDPPVHQFSVPLTFPISMQNFDAAANGRGSGTGLERYTYGFLELIDYDIPRFEPEIVTDTDVTGYQIHSGLSAISFRFRCNYVRGSQVLGYYKQTYVDQTSSVGYLNAATSGVISSVVLKDSTASPFIYGKDDLPAAGRLYLKNAAGESETIAFTAVTAGTDIQTFTVDATTDLANVYAEDDIIEVIDPTIDGREGPSSEDSKLVSLDPGTFTVLGLSDNFRYPTSRLYRSPQTEEGYRLLNDGESPTFVYGDQIYAPSGPTYYFFLRSAFPLYKGLDYESITLTASAARSSFDDAPEQGIIRLTNTTGGESQVFFYVSRSTMTDAGGGFNVITFYLDKTTAANYTFKPTAEQVNADLWEIDETAGRLVYERYTEVLGDPLPEEGNYPHTSITNALTGSVRHPAGWGALIYNNKLYPSDVARPWAYPEDYIVEFDSNILMVVVSGGSLLVFTDTNTAGTEVGKVYEVVGNNPAYLSVYELSKGHPLLNTDGMAKIGQMAIWPSTDGLVATSGGQVQVLTEKYFTREEWADQAPSLMNAYTSENTVWLTTSGYPNWRVDLDELASESPNICLSTYTAFSGVPFYWESKIFEYPRPIAFSCIRVIAEDYPVAVEMYTGKGELRHSELVADDQVKKMKRMRLERDWYLRIHGTNTVYSVGVSTNPQELSAYGG